MTWLKSPEPMTSVADSAGAGAGAGSGSGSGDVSPQVVIRPRKGAVVSTDHAIIYGEYITVRGRGCQVIGDYNYIYGDDCVVEGMFNKVYGRNATAPGHNTIFRSAERKQDATTALIDTASSRRQRLPMQRQRPEPQPPRHPAPVRRQTAVVAPRSNARPVARRPSGLTIFGVDIGSHLERLYSQIPESSEEDAESAEMRRQFVIRLRGIQQSSAPAPPAEEAKLPVVTAASAAPAAEQKAPGLQCCACTERISNAVLEPCMHICVCRECSITLQATTNKCPVCRGAITFARPIFYAGGT